MPVIASSATWSAGTGICPIFRDAIGFPRSLVDLEHCGAPCMAAILQLAIDICCRQQRQPNPDWETHKDEALEGLGRPMMVCRNSLTTSMSVLMIMLQTLEERVPDKACLHVSGHFRDSLVPAMENGCR